MKLGSLILGVILPSAVMALAVYKLTNDRMAGVLVAFALSLALSHITLEIRNLKK